MLNVIMLNVIMLSIIMLNAIMPSVVAPYETYLGGADMLTNLPEFGKAEKSCIGKKYKLKCW